MLKSETALAIGDTLMFVNEMGGELQMRRAWIPPDNHCGTAACHLGWLEWAMGAPANGHVGEFMPLVNSNVGENLSLWAHYNASVWGNRDGSIMFGACEAGPAFGLRKGQEPTLEIIAKHWWEVAKRIAKQEN